MRDRHRVRAAGLILMVLAGATACSSDGGMQPASQTTFDVMIKNVSTVYEFPESGTFDTGVGADAPGPIMSGGSFSFEFYAARGQRISFATMFAQSNDFFYAPGEDGIALYDQDGTPRSGDVTSEVQLWDAGTEVNQEPGLGPDQAPRQAAPDTGAPDPNDMVRAAPDDFGNLPADADVIKVTLEHLSGTRFRMTIMNVSTPTTLTTSEGTHPPIPLSPGVWVVTDQTAPLFTVGEPVPPHGLEHVAEDGAASDLGSWLADNSGLSTPLAPGVWAVHTSPNPFFDAGQPDRGDGLEGLAEDAAPGMLASSVIGETGVKTSGVFDTPDGASSPGPIQPGQTFTLQVSATPGDHLSFATMFGQSNDLFYAPDGTGISLFSNGQPISGDVTSQIQLWDAGTEVNQAPGFGPDQAPRQAAPNTGASENGDVAPVDDGFTYPPVSQVIQVTITPSSP